MLGLFKIVFIFQAWIEHFEDDSELQRCGGCGRRFERRAALISHAQICHKRIAACNSTVSPKRKEEKNETNNDVVVIPVKQQSTQGTVIQKVQSEKRIGIQVRMNYCKNSIGQTGMETRRSERHKSCEEKDEDVELNIPNSILKERLLCQPNEFINSVKLDVIKDENEKSVSCSIIEDELNCSNSCKKPYSSANSNTNKCSSNKDIKIKSKRLESMCYQLRKAVGLEVDDNKNSPTDSINYSENIDEQTNVITHTKSPFCAKIKASSRFKTREIDKNGDSKSKLETDSHDMKLDPLKDNTIVNSFKENDEHQDGYTELKDDNNLHEKVFSDQNETSNYASVLPLAAEKTLDDSGLSSANKKGSLMKNDLENDQMIDSRYSLEKNDGVSCDNISEVVDKETAKDSVGILTRYKVRSIFKNDSSGLDNVSSDFLDQDELSNVDESCVKENLNDALSDEQSQCIYKKMSEYIRYKNKQCLICLKKFKMIAHIRQHIADHLGWNNYHCLFSNCTFTTFLKSDCVKHLMKTHLKPHEKHRASSLVGELGPIKSDNCDIDFTNIDCGKRKIPDSEELCLKQPDIKESINSEFKLSEKDSVTVISVNNDDSSELIGSGDFESASRVDSSCSEQNSDVDHRIQRRFKRRKTNEYKKHLPPVVRKCSPDSTTELVEKDLKNSDVCAQFRDGKLKSNLISKKYKP